MIKKISADNTVNKKDHTLLHSAVKIFPALFLASFIISCVSDTVNHRGTTAIYGERLAVSGPQERTGNQGLERLIPARDPKLPELKTRKNPKGKTEINLSLEDAVLRALAKSPEITVVSYDPSIAKESVTVAASEFDITAFGEVGYDKNDILSNDSFQSGQSHSSLWEAGIKQKGTTGAEWSLAYSLNRSFDESASRNFTTAYEPVLKFELRQPLLRNAWSDVNLAGVNIAKLNYRIATESFRRKAEEVSAQVTTLYWSLLQARRNIEIQESLLSSTTETLRKVEDRKDIDATLGDVKQAETSLKNRTAVKLEAEKKLLDIQDRLVRLIAGHQMNLTEDLEVIPVSVPDKGNSDLDQSEMLNLALAHNPEISRAELEAEVAEINVKVAKKQMKPRLDIVASTQMQGLSDGSGEANDLFSSGDYNSYSIGLVLDYPIGNREKNAKFRLNKLKHAKALSNVQNISDRVASLVKDRIRSAETAHEEIQIQKEAVSAATIHLQSLEDIEEVRKSLTPEFLLAKIQAQDLLANAQKAEIKAVVDYNISLTQLLQAAGTVLNLRSENRENPYTVDSESAALMVHSNSTDFSGPSSSKPAEEIRGKTGVPAAKGSMESGVNPWMKRRIFAQEVLTKLKKYYPDSGTDKK